jgi:hypothetical protein
MSEVLYEVAVSGSARGRFAQIHVILTSPSRGTRGVRRMSIRRAFSGVYVAAAGHNRHSLYLR